MTEIHFTPTEKRILAVLSDGKPHKRQELRDCMPDELSNGGLANHINKIGKKIDPEGQKIVCVAPRLEYQLVRKIALYSKE